MTRGKEKEAREIMMIIRVISAPFFVPRASLFPKG